MNKRNKVGAAFLAACLAVPVVQAGGFDADTVAFYPFMDKAVGETAATGDAITNAVDASTCEGSVKLMYKTADAYGSLTFEKFPYPYVYSDWSRTTLLTSEAQSVHIRSNATTGTGGATVHFAEAAKALAKDGGSFTIETFWRCADPNGRWISFQITGGRDEVLFDNNSNRIRSQWNDTWKGYVDYGTPIVGDGLWHHLAIVCDTETGKTRLIGDYTLNSPDETNVDLPEEAFRTFLLGADLTATNRADAYYQVKDIEFACLRFTKRKLSPTEFMVAYDAPVDQVGKTETVFHWGFDGADGENVGSLSDRAACGLDLETMAKQFVYAGKTKSKVPTGMPTAQDLKNVGCGSVGSDTTGYTNPVYCVESDRRLSRLVAGGVDIATNNVGSGQLLATADSKWGLASGAGFVWKTNTLSAVTGAFTVECLTRLNLPNWQAKVIDVNVAIGQARWRTTLLGRAYLAGDSGVWEATRDSGAISLRAYPGSSGKTTFELRCTYYDDSDGSVKYKAYELQDENGKQYQMDNASFAAKYHHFAISYDPATRQARAYVDYRKMREETIPGTVALDHSARWLFGTGYNGCSFDGWYDEIRLTRKILEPSEFLVQKRPVSGIVIIVR